MNGLGLAEYMAIAGLCGGIMGAPTTVMILVLKSLRSEQAEARLDLRRLEERVAEVEQGKVSHGDWVRVATSNNNRLARLSEQLCELSGKIEGSMGLASVGNRIASAIEGKSEAHHD